jgi:GH24 family phage-related lysozyme (muramidase)
MKTKISKKGVELIKTFEGFRLTAYQDSGGVWTIGYGHTGVVDGKPIKAGMVITTLQANELLCEDIHKFETIVNGYDRNYRWTQNEFDALVSFAYNLGTLRMLTNNGTRTKEEIALKIPEYHHMAGKYVKGLHVRRLQETLYFLQGRLD